MAVIVDGKLVFAVEEERFTRHRHSPGEFPTNSLLEAFAFLKGLGIGPGDVEAFALNYDPKLKLFSESMHLLRGTASAVGSPVTSALRSIDAFVLRKCHSMLRRAYSISGNSPPDKINIVPVAHHLAHAASAHYFSGFSSSSVLTADGLGEVASTVVWKAKNGEFEAISSVNAWEGSLGILYERVCQALGFDFLSGPGKVMGLAPYGRNMEKLSTRFDQIIRFNVLDGPYAFSRRFGFASGRHTWGPMYARLIKFLTSGFDLSWNPRRELEPNPSALALAAQHFIENAMLRTAEWTKAQTGSDKLLLAGGVALNAKANMKLHYSKLFSDIFVFPAAADQGACVGAAAYVYEHTCGGKMSHGRLARIDFGPQYDDDSVKSTVREAKYPAEFVGDDFTRIAELLAKGKVVGWFQGRSEFGPRALGNRSLIADPRRKDNWSKLNVIKGRESWRPVCPSLLSSDKDDYFEDPVDHEFMVMMFRMKADARERVPAVCHVDSTSRPQTVERNANPTWYDLIRSFKEATGEGMLINTSFNLAGEPLVRTPEQALRDFAIGGLDALYLQGHLIEKPLSG